MKVALAEGLSWIPIAVLISSLLGSSHCLAMCGGLIGTVAQTRQGVVAYHLGRLFGYCALGALAGLLGESLLESAGFLWIPWLSTVLLAGGFIFLGIRVWNGQSLHLFRLPAPFWKRAVSFGPGVTGLLSAFLPCGWLHAFVLGSLTTRSPLRGALYLAFFWMGTLPALSIAPFALTQLLRPLVLRAPKLSAIILVSVGLGSLGLKVFPGSYGILQSLMSLQSGHEVLHHSCSE